MDADIKGHRRLCWNWGQRNWERIIHPESIKGKVHLAAELERSEQAETRQEYSPMLRDNSFNAITDCNMPQSSPSTPHHLLARVHSPLSS